MAKRKRGKRKGFKLQITPDYRSERYVMYIMSAETGILEAATIDPDLTDGEVSQALQGLITELQEPQTFTNLFSAQSAETDEPALGEDGLVQQMVLMNLRRAFDKHGPLGAEDVVGILEVIKTSAKRWGVGPHRRGYLTYLAGFLAQAGIEPKLLTEEELSALGLTAPDLIEQGDNDE